VKLAIESPTARKLGERISVETTHPRGPQDIEKHAK